MHINVGRLWNCTCKGEIFVMSKGVIALQMGFLQQHLSVLNAQSYRHGSKIHIEEYSRCINVAITHENVFSSKGWRRKWPLIKVVNTYLVNSEL